MNRVIFAFIIITMLLAGCSGSTNSIQGQIEDVKENGLSVDCSDEVNRGKKDVNTMGYGCFVEFSNQTIFRDEDGNYLAANEFTSGSIVRVILSKPVNIRKNIESDKPSILIAREVILLMREEVTSKEAVMKELENQGLSVTKRCKSPSEQKLLKGWSV